MRSIGMPELTVLLIIAALFLVMRVTRYFCLGVAAGGIIGFLLRPVVPLVGQLPLDVVLTRGSDLRGVDAVLKGAAETSFNYMLAGVLVGGLGGLVLATLVKTSKRATAPVQSQPTSTAAQADLTQAERKPTSPSNRFCANCGATLPGNSNYCGACGAKKASA